VIAVVCTAAESTPWVDIGEIAVVIDSRLCELPCYNHNTDSIVIGHCIAPLSVHLQRCSLLGKRRPGFIVAATPYPGGCVSDFPEFHRCDQTRAVLILKSLGFSFDGLSIPTPLSSTAMVTIESFLSDIKAIDAGKGVTEFGKGILRYPGSLRLIHIATMIRYSQGVSLEKELNVGIVFLVISAGLQLLQPTKPTSAAAMECFCPLSDVVTLLRIVAPLLVNRTHDRELIDRFGLDSLALDRLRSDVDGLIHFFNLSRGHLEKFMELDHLTFVDSIVSCMAIEFPQWYRAHLFRYVKTLPVRKFGQDCTSLFTNPPFVRNHFALECRPARANSSVPSACLAFSSRHIGNSERKVITMIHRDPALSQEIEFAIIAQEFDSSLHSHWLIRLLEIAFQASDTFFITANEAKTHINFTAQMKNRLSEFNQTVERITPLLPFVGRSVIYHNGSDPWVIEIISHGTTYESTLHHLETIHYYAIRETALRWLADHLDQLRGANPPIRIAWEYGTTHSLNLAILSERDISEFVGVMRCSLSSWLRTSETNFPRMPRVHNTYFQIPAKVCHPSMLFLGLVRDIIEQWASNRIARRVRVTYGGRLEVDLHERTLLTDSLDSLVIPYKAVPIIDIDSAETVTALATFRKRHSETMRIDRRYRVVIVPDVLGDEMKRLMDRPVTVTTVEAGSLALGCILLCNDPERPTLTQQQITVFHEDGHRTIGKLCRTCQEESLVSMVGKFLDPDRGRDLLLSNRDKIPMIPIIDCSENEEREMWPQIPIGSLLLALLQENERIAGLINVWIQAVYQHALHTSTHLVQFCPNHPTHPVAMHPNEERIYHCAVLDCYLAYCPHCHEWHQGDQACLTATEEKKCPQCNIPISKAGGCNHITCPCGCHWCYKCMAKFNSPHECYTHLSLIHGGLGIGEDDE
jgi:hypothetical protein